MMFRGVHRIFPRGGADPEDVEGFLVLRVRQLPVRLVSGVHPGKQVGWSRSCSAAPLRFRSRSCGSRSREQSCYKSGEEQTNDLHGGCGMNMVCCCSCGSTVPM